jgi:hypothetical protein
MNKYTSIMSKNNFVKLINTSLTDESTNFKYSEGLHICDDIKGFKIIDAEMGKFGNWATMPNVRWYAEVLLDDAKVLKTGYWEYSCDRMTLAPLKNIYDHPHFNILYHYDDGGHLLKLIPVEKLTKAVCNKIGLRKPYYIEHLPEEVLTDSLIMMRLKDNSSYFRRIPKNKLNQEMTDYAFEADIDLFSDIPKHLKTEKMIADYNYYVKLRSRQGP